MPKITVVRSCFLINFTKQPTILITTQLLETMPTMPSKSSFTMDSSKATPPSHTTRRPMELEFYCGRCCNWKNNMRFISLPAQLSN